MEMDPEDRVARDFVNRYYATFDSNRVDLASFYQEGSMLTFDGQEIKGSENIVAKLTSLPIVKCEHIIHTFDCQPSDPAGGMVVSVVGGFYLFIAQPLKFTQLFHLKPTDDGGHYVLNDIFRFKN